MTDPAKIFGDWISKDSEKFYFQNVYNINGIMIGSVWLYKPLKDWYYKIPMFGESSQNTKSEQYAKKQVFNRLIKLGYRYDPRMTNLL